MKNLHYGNFQDNRRMASTASITPPYRSTPYQNPTWVLFIDPESHEPYFFNTVTGETSWEDPEPPVGAALFEKEKQRAKERLEQGDIGTEEIDEDIEKNYYLQTMIEREIDRGIPPYLSDDWRTRPARKQTERDNSKFSYREGTESYNKWYGRYSKDRFDDTIRETASTVCDPWLDPGWTQADSRNSEEASFCLWFAKGCCTKGSACRYKHRVPTKEDDTKNEHMMDIFGRERHANHKDDMGGVGSFMKECKTLYISEITIDRTQPDCIQRMEAQLWKLFHPWGPIESIRVIPNRMIAFVKYEYRSAAEFAKVACADQPCGIAEAINVRWAFEDPNPRAVEQGIIDTRDQFFAAIEARIASMSHQERIERGLLESESRDDPDFEDRFETISPDKDDDS
jgi:hypothetical protein